MPDTGTLTYGSAVKTALGYQDAVQRVRALLKDEGFGVLCEIDVAKTLHEKLGVGFRPYLILGACNPPFAHAALTQEAQLGLLLPCNLVVQADDEGCVVSAIDARAMLGLVGNPALIAVAAEIDARLARILERIRTSAEGTPSASSR